MGQHSITFKINTRMIGVIFCVFVILGFISVHAAGRSVLTIQKELLEKILADQTEFIQTRFTSLDNMGMAQDKDSIAKYQEQIFEKLKSFKYKNTGNLYIVDDTGKVLMQSRKDAIKDISNKKFYDFMKTQRQGMVSYPINGISHSAVFDSFNPWKWTIVLEMEDNEIYTPIHALAWVFFEICCSFLILIAAIFYLGTSLGITKPINKIIQGLLDGVAMTVGAVGKLSALSKQLSHGAQEQASAVKQTLDAMDEMTAKTNQNASNSLKANQMTSFAKEQAQKGLSSMQEMQTAMEGINESSNKVSQILKTIEEIAFQTNLLALNASVEAARAGEHGLGFAVVADEVRNLAKRASLAAKDTSILINDCQKRTKQGAQISKKTGEALEQIMDTTKQVADVVNQIALASKEQSEGINQVAQAISRMEKVTQQHTATAEESDTSSKELSIQAEKLNEIVMKLQQIVQGEKFS